MFYMMADQGHLTKSLYMTCGCGFTSALRAGWADGRLEENGEILQVREEKKTFFTITSTTEFLDFETG